MEQPMKLDFVPEYKKNLKEIADFVLKEVKEELLNLKYATHNPTKMCQCEECRVVDIIINKFKI